MRGTNPAWANLPKRHCDDCGKLYKPKQPLREGMRGFCCANCRKSYHKHGGAYRKLRTEVERLVDRRTKELAEQVRKLIAPMLDDVVRAIVRQEMEEATVDIQTVADYGHDFLQGQIRPKPLGPQHVHTYRGTGGPCTTCGRGIYVEDQQRQKSVPVLPSNPSRQA